VSLLSYIDLNGIKKREAKVIADKVGNLDGISIRPIRKGFFEKGVLFWVSGIHEILTDDADWNAETWDMEKSGLLNLSKIFERFMEEVKSDFRFWALWAGDRPDKEMSVSRAQMIEIIKSGKIGTKTCYLVERA